MDISFGSVKELYNRVTPALKSKKKELKNKGITYIKEEDIWNYLINTKWKKEKGLVLYDIVDDILNVENEKIEEFVKDKMEKTKRKIDLDSEIL